MTNQANQAQATVEYDDVARAIDEAILNDIRSVGYTGRLLAAEHVFRDPMVLKFYRKNYGHIQRLVLYATRVYPDACERIRDRMSAAERKASARALDALEESLEHSSAAIRQGLATIDAMVKAVSEDAFANLEAEGITEYAQPLTPPRRHQVYMTGPEMKRLFTLLKGVDRLLDAAETAVIEDQMTYKEVKTLRRRLQGTLVELSKIAESQRGKLLRLLEAAKQRHGIADGVDPQLDRTIAVEAASIVEHAKANAPETEESAVAL